LKIGENLKVGNIAQLSVHKVDTTKLLPNHIMALLVDMDEQENCIRIALEKEVLKGQNNYMRLKGR
jgi:hypothetical protein